METPGSSFLHERNPSLHASQEVEGVVDYLREAGDAIPNQPADKISAYLDFLADEQYVNDGILTGDEDSIDRQVSAHVIKEEDVPEAHFDLHRRVAREQGYGDVQMDDWMRGQLTEIVQADQRVSLGKWVEYLGGDDGGYPDWFKHYTWTSVTKLGVYDKQKQEFQKRSRGTTAIYPELDREALANVYDVLHKSRIQGEQAEDITQDPQLQKLIESGNFGKLHAYAISEMTTDNPELRDRTEGSWRQFEQTTDRRAVRRLSESLQGHGTGWCTAGETTAAMQLRHGDFYVYYTRDNKGKDTIPRVAVRMQRDKVAEVRGVNAGQALESEMIDITSEKLETLPGGERYTRIAKDMKHLTALDKQTLSDPDVELAPEEVGFLYGLDHEVLGFGFGTDPRAHEIRERRGDRDESALRRAVLEDIRGQMPAAYSAYKAVATGLGKAAISEDAMQELFEAKDEEWRTGGVYDFMIEQLAEYGVRHGLVATPNVEATASQIVDLSRTLGATAQSTWALRSNLDTACHFTDQELSGNTGSDPVRISLVPSRCMYRGVFSKRIAEQEGCMTSEDFLEFQSAHPSLHARGSSVLDAVTRLYNARERRDDERTVLYHFDVEPKQESIGPAESGLHQYRNDYKSGYLPSTCMREGFYVNQVVFRINVSPEHQTDYGTFVIG